MANTLNQVYGQYCDNYSHENWELLWTQIRRELQRMARPICRDRLPSQEVGDVLATALVGVLEVFPTYDPAKSAISTWLQRVGTQRINAAVAAMQRPEEVELDPESAAHSPEDGFIADIGQSDKVRALLAKLPAADREFVRLKFWDGLSEEELAQHFGKNGRWAHNKWEQLRKEMAG